MAKINLSIPEFTAEAFYNGGFETVTMDGVKGKWSIFLFYPAYFTFVCQTELEDMANDYEELQELGVEVYTVSTDTHYAHQAWHDTSETIGKFKLLMIGDPTGSITCGCDAKIEESALAMRGTFLTNPMGIISVNIQ